MLINVPRLITAYFSTSPDPSQSAQRVAFGTSGHRGSALDGSFNEAHILATTQAICDARAAQGIDGPLYLGIDTHALSEPAMVSALEVLVANGVAVHIDAQGGYTPTPVVSHAICSYNRGRAAHLADGIIVTPSHNPPEDGGFKYNPPHGGPADTGLTARIEEAANRLIEGGLVGVKRVPIAAARRAAIPHDFVTPYVEGLAEVIDLDAIAGSSLSIGVDPLGGSGIGYWAPIAERWKLKLEVVNPVIDPTFAFMSLDKDGRIRMDCSSPWAMASLIRLKDRYDIAFGNDCDYDRHGIVTKSGLMNPNHYLAVAIDYLYTHRSGWRSDAAIGKTLVSSSMIDRVAAALGRPLKEVPVGFKWFVPGLLDGSFGFGGEESAGASFLRQDGTTWTTDKDGFILDLLAAELTAKTGQDPAAHYRRLTERHGAPIYERLDAPATKAQKDVLKKLSPAQVQADTLAGEAITAKLTKAPGNDALIGGLKVTTQNGWFAARPSGTEDVYKIYSESFLGQAHLSRIQEEAQAIVGAAFKAAGV